MAIELPGAGPESVTVSRRPRRARLPDAGDVPIQPAARDPGLQVPDMGQEARGLADLGAGITELGVRLAEADDRINRRRDAIERLRTGREFKNFGRELLEDYQSSRDLSQPADMEAFGTELNAKMQEFLEAYTGSEEGRLQLEGELTASLGVFSDRAAVASVKAQDAIIQREFAETINGLAARVRFQQDPEELIDEGMAFMEMNKDTLRPGQEIAFERNLKKAVWGAKISDYMSQGAFENAEALLREPEIQAALSPEEQQRIFSRIDATRQGFDPKDFYMNVPGVGLVDLRGDKPKVALPISEMATAKGRYKNVSGVGLVDLQAEGGPKVVIPTAEDLSIQDVVAPIMQKMSKGEELTEGERATLDTWQKATTQDLILREALAPPGQAVNRFTNMSLEELGNVDLQTLTDEERQMYDEALKGHGF